jgi:hypothetical protein
MRFRNRAFWAVNSIAGVQNPAKAPLDPWVLMNIQSTESILMLFILIYLQAWMRQPGWTISVNLREICWNR